MSHIQSTIRNYIGGKSTDQLSDYTLRCFVGMIETEEASLDDFRIAGGADLELLVWDAIETGRFKE